MKKIVLYIVFMITALMMSCEEKYDMYSEPDNRLNIISDTLINYTFTIKPASVMLDTVSEENYIVALPDTEYNPNL